jgi:hypothetical protein
MALERFSSEVDTGSRKENASKQKTKARLLQRRGIVEGSR